MNARFLLGTITITEDVKALLGRSPYDLVARHAILENGVVSARRRKLNAMAMATGDEIVSEYLSDPTDPDSPHIRIVTSGGWGKTRISVIKNQPRKAQSHEPAV